VEIVDQDFYIEYLNESAHLILLNYSSKEIIGKNLKHFVFTKDLDRMIKALEKALKLGENKVEFRIQHKKDRYLWVEAKVKRFLDSSDNTKLLLISRDITEQKNVEKFVREITEWRKTETLFKKEIRKLKELDKIRKDLISGISHELKTPLMAIYGASELLLEIYKDQIGKDASELVTMIERGGHRLGELINKLLDISRIEYDKLKLEKKKENLSNIIKEASKDMSYLLKERNVILNLELPEVLNIQLDKLRIEQVITNILSNAIKNSPPQGIIIISLCKKDNWAEIVFNDMGIGLTEEEKEQLFARFGKIERYGPDFEYIDIRGSGLGLFITKEILTLHGGEIWAQSQGRNKGSTFTVRIPIN
jgi:PAS domain S-box-containing protein